MPFDVPHNDMFTCCNGSCDNEYTGQMFINSLAQLVGYNHCYCSTCWDIFIFAEVDNNCDNCKFDFDLNVQNLKTIFG